MRYSRCRSCDAAIFWGTTATRKSIPVDANPVRDGNVVVTSQAGASPITVRMLRKGEAYDGDRFVSHFVTCPHSAQHRGAR